MLYPRRFLPSKQASSDWVFEFEFMDEIAARQIHFLFYMGAAKPEIHFNKNKKVWGVIKPAINPEGKITACSPIPDFVYCDHSSDTYAFDGTNVSRANGVCLPVSQKNIYRALTQIINDNFNNYFPQHIKLIDLLKNDQGYNYKSVRESFDNWEVFTDIIANNADLEILTGFPNYKYIDLFKTEGIIQPPVTMFKKTVFQHKKKPQKQQQQQQQPAPLRSRQTHLKLNKEYGNQSSDSESEAGEENTTEPVQVKPREKSESKKKTDVAIVKLKNDHVIHDTLCRALLPKTQLQSGGDQIEPELEARDKQDLLLMNEADAMKWIIATRVKEMVDVVFTCPVCKQDCNKDKSTGIQPVNFMTKLEPCSSCVTSPKIPKLNQYVIIQGSPNSLLVWTKSGFNLTWALSESSVFVLIDNCWIRFNKRGEIANSKVIWDHETSCFTDEDGMLLEGKDGELASMKYIVFGTQ